MAERNVKEYINGLVQRAKVAQKEFERTALDQLTIDKVVRAIGKTVVDAKEELALVVMGNEKLYGTLLNLF